jgi:hypothetical protein
VVELLARLRALLLGGEGTQTAEYRAACVCGNELSGPRRRRPQTVRCPSCARPAFVLGHSPYPPIAGRGPRRRWWGRPLVAAVVTLAVIALLFVWLGPRLRRGDEPPEAPPYAELARERLADARKLLAKGSFHRAAEEARAAADARDRVPAQLSRDEHFQINQTLLEADLLDRLLPVPLEALLAQAEAARDPEQWQARFRRDYQGRAALFYAAVRLEGRTPVFVDDRVRGGGTTARVSLDGLQALAELHLTPGQRLLFGARLASFARQDDGWVIRLEPDSGVLLTDLEVLRRCPPDLIALDDEAPEVLRRQERELRALPPPRLPGRP